MFIITHVKELAIWLTDTPTDKRSGTWCFYNTREDYDHDLEVYKDKYGSKFILTLNKVENITKGKTLD